MFRILIRTLEKIKVQLFLWRKPGQLKANVSLLGVNANYELRLLKYSTLNLEAGIVSGVRVSVGYVIL
ncbi:MULTISPECIES: hypothetical protein [unclassified Chitinophaga]|uniref:hypothetical protein n=1 Tax=unclassified Chitinophaga TaxID=2619133 RepID=UPI00305EC714